MSKKTVLKKEVTGTTDENMINKSKKNQAVDRVPRKIKKKIKSSTAAQINAVERSAVGAVRANSSKTVRGSSGLANTGTIISY
ncbi:MAG: hypothetical protein M3004_14525 [Bacteroidota bacterium]|nr:hypothetical protein [Bacteroidota bacterium]